MSKHTPGPFYSPERSGAIRCRGRPGTQHVAMTPLNMDRSELERMVDLLNKGTHFDEMLAALKHMMGEYAKVPDEVGEIGNIRRIIAKAEPGAAISSADLIESTDTPEIRGAIGPKTRHG